MYVYIYVERTFSHVCRIYARAYIYLHYLSARAFLLIRKDNLRNLAHRGRVEDFFLPAGAVVVQLSRLRRAQIPVHTGIYKCSRVHIRSTIRKLSFYYLQCTFIHHARSRPEKRRKLKLRNRFSCTYAGPPRATISVANVRFFFNFTFSVL